MVADILHVVGAFSSIGIDYIVADIYTHSIQHPQTFYSRYFLGMTSYWLCLIYAHNVLIVNISHRNN